MIHVVKRKFEPHPVETIIKKSTPEWLDIHVKVVSICQCVSFLFVFNDLMVGNIDDGID